MSDESRIPPRGARPSSHTNPASTDRGTQAELRAGHSKTLGESREGAARAQPGPVSIAGYEVLGELGRGAMGVVYRARHVKLNRPVALKMVLGGVDEKDLIRFLAEAEAVASVRHENVVEVYDYGESGGRPFMALEFCLAGSLAEVLKEEGPMDPLDAAEMVGRIAAGVAAAHELGIVHRDLKPANILLQVDPRQAHLPPSEIETLPFEELTPKVSDFGLAKRVASELTATQAVMGTPSYMSPEQAVGKTKFVGPPADVWALGVILYECLAGKRPFTGGSTYELLAQILSDEPASVRTIRATVPSDLELVCRKCLEKNPADRYPTARELADDLERFVRGEPISVRPLSTGARAGRWVKRNPVVAGLLGLVVLVTFGLIGALYGMYNAASARAAVAEREREAEQAAAQERARAEQEATKVAVKTKQADALIAALNEILRSSDPMAAIFGEVLPTLGLASVDQDRAKALFPFLQAAAAQFRATLTEPSDAPVRARLLTSIGTGMKNLGKFREAKDLLSEALALRRGLLSDKDPELWRSERELGAVEAESGDLDAAAERLRKLAALQQRAGASEAEVLNTRLFQGAVLVMLGVPEAEPLLKSVVADRRRLFGESHKDTLIAQMGLIIFLVDEERWNDVIAETARFVAALEKQPDARVRGVLEPIVSALINCAKAYININNRDSGGVGGFLLGNLSDNIRRIKECTAALAKALSVDHIYAIFIRFETARFLLYAGQSAEADELLARVLVDLEKTVGLAHPRVLRMLHHCSERLVERGKVAEARELFQKFERAGLERFTADSSWRTMFQLERASFEAQTGRPEDALAAADEAVRLAARGKVVRNHHTAYVLWSAAVNLSARVGTLDRRLTELFALAQKIVPDVYGSDRWLTSDLTVAEAVWRYRAGDRAGGAERIEAAERALAPMPRHRQWAALRYWRGRIELDRGRPAVAQGYFETVLKGAKTPNSAEASFLIDATQYLAAALVAQEKFREAVPHLEEYRRLTRSAAADRLVALAKLAAGDRDGHGAEVKAMAEKYAKSSSLQALAQVGWAGGVAGPAGWDAAALADRLAQALPADGSYRWGQRALALSRLRAGDAAGAEAALSGGGPAWPCDSAILGLVAAARGDRSTARAHLERAEKALLAEQPTAERPFGSPETSWDDRLAAALLAAELRAVVAPPKG